MPAPSRRCCPLPPAHGHTDTGTHGHIRTLGVPDPKQPVGAPPAWLTRGSGSSGAVTEATGTRGPQAHGDARMAGNWDGGHRDPPVCAVGSGTMLGASPQRGELSTSSIPAPNKERAGSRGLRDALGCGAAVGQQWGCFVLAPSRQCLLNASIQRAASTAAQRPTAARSLPADGL